VYICYSYFPWFEIFYRLLNHFAELLNQGKTVAVQSLLVKLYESRVPWQGMLVELQVDSDDAVSGVQNMALGIFCFIVLCSYYMLTKMDHSVQYHHDDFVLTHVLNCTNSCHIQTRHLTRHCVLQTCVMQGKEKVCLISFIGNIGTGGTTSWCNFISKQVICDFC